MGAPVKHESLNPADRSGSSDVNGRWIPIAGRTGASYPWTVTVDCGHIETGSLTVRVEVAQRRSEDGATTVHTFGTLSTPATQSTTVTLSGYMARGYLRTVANMNGTAIFGTTEEAQMFNVTAESGRLDRRTQQWNELTEAQRAAEADLLDDYRIPGGYALQMDAHGFAEDVRHAIAQQIENRFQMHALSRSDDPSAVVTLRNRDAVDRDAKRAVARFSASRGTVYF